MGMSGLLAERTGRLSLDDMARHVPVRVAVPAGIGALRIRFEHAPQHPGVGEIPHQLSISVLGPAGPRGTRHNNADQGVFLSEHRASPGYLQGAIEPGEWTVEIDCHRILPPGGIDWRIEVRAEEAPVPDESLRPATIVPRLGPGWFRGDLHRHTDHSDAVWSSAEMVADARARGYDFAALTDHNTVSAIAEAQALAGADLLILPGMELTTFHGHALALGSGRMWDWRIRDGQTMSARADEIMAAGDAFVIAHPMSAGHPFCTGCFWAWSDMMPGPARLVEVWNGLWGAEPKNPLGLDLFQSWLNAGHRLVATAGSDDHGRYGSSGRPGHMLIHAKELSVAGLLAGLSRGHAVLTSGPVLSVEGRLGAGGIVLPGDMAAGLAELAIGWSGAEPGGRLRIVTGERGAGVVRVVRDEAAGSEGTFGLPADALGPADWVMVELRHASGAMQALANPLFLTGG